MGQQSAYYRCNGATAGSVASIVGSRDVAGKTGSSDGNVTESFVAYTPQMAIASIAANPTTSKDAVGAAVQREVIQAVARTLTTSLKGVAEQKFTAPKLTSAFASGYEPREEPSPTPSESTDRNNGNDNGGRKNRNTTPTPSTSPTSGLGGIFGGWGN